MDEMCLGLTEASFTKDPKNTCYTLVNFLSKYVFWELSDNHMLSIKLTNTLVR